MKFGGIEWHSDLDMALEQSRQTNSPVWICVIDRRSPWSYAFEDSISEPGAKDLLQNFFVPLLVDRRSNRALSTAAQNLGSLFGVSGWPLNLVVDNLGRPFFACSMVQPRGENNLAMYLARVKWLWLMAREKVDAGAASIVEKLQTEACLGDEKTVDWKGLADQSWREDADQEVGGYGAGPKFLSMPRLMLSSDLDFVRKTTSALALGGSLKDHLRGGYREYCSDVGWTTPLLARSLDAGAAAALALDFGAALIESPFLFAEAQKAAEAWQSLMKDGELCEEEIPYDRRRGYVNALVSSSMVNTLVGQEQGAFLTRCFDLDRGWIHPVSGEKFKASVPCLIDPVSVCHQWNLNPVQFFEKLQQLSEKLAKGLSPMPLNEISSLWSSSWAMYAMLRSARRQGIQDCPVVNGWLIRTLKQVDQYDRLPCAKRDGLWIGEGGMETYAALAMVLLEQGDEVFRLRAIQLLQQYERESGEILGLSLSQLPVLIGLGDVDDVLPSPMATWLVACWRSGDEALQKHAQTLLKRLGGRCVASPGLHAGMIAAGLEIFERQRIW